MCAMHPDCLRLQKVIRLPFHLKRKTLKTMKAHLKTFHVHPARMMQPKPKRHALVLLWTKLR